MVVTNEFAISPSDGLMQITSPGGAYLWWMACCALLNGAALCQLDVRRWGLADVAAAVRRGDITVFHGRDMLRRLAPTLGAEETLDRVRLVTMGGDTVFASDVELYRRHFGRSCRLLVGYGTTEGGRISTHSVDRDSGVEDGLIPVGEAVEDTCMLLIGEDGREAGSEPGATGEIAVRSRFLSPGYWRRPDLTAAASRSDPRNRRQTDKDTVFDVPHTVDEVEDRPSHRMRRHDAQLSLIGCSAAVYRHHRQLDTRRHHHLRAKVQ
jgi:non-ribosomal peptide synthetase component F